MATEGTRTLRVREPLLLNHPLPTPPELGMQSNEPGLPLNDYILERMGFLLVQQVADRGSTTTICLPYGADP